jgi:23S rRNA (cytidine1920-2'-O)/16S rRNA (cytidine1409-2'-O)-methyltransferase
MTASTDTRRASARRSPPRAAKRRLDDLLVDRGLATDREHARALILARQVLLQGQVALRAAAPLPADAILDLKHTAPYVSRGGEKLAHALQRTGVTVESQRCLDVGASTGGFTDCLLQHRAAHVVAVDVAYGELVPSLRDHDRVTVVERTNARDLAPLEPPAALATIDVSFISLTTVLPAVARSLRPGADLLALVKPQFEADRDVVERGGVVHASDEHARVVGRVAVWSLDHGFRVRGVVRSPLIGPAGNREFFLWLRTAETAAS